MNSYVDIRAHKNRTDGVQLDKCIYNKHIHCS